MKDYSRQYSIDNRVYIVFKTPQPVSWHDRLKFLFSGQCQLKVTVDCENAPGDTEAETEFTVLPVKTEKITCQPLAVGA